MIGFKHVFALCVLVAGAVAHKKKGPNHKGYQNVQLRAYKDDSCAYAAGGDGTEQGALVRNLTNNQCYGFGMTPFVSFDYKYLNGLDNDQESCLPECFLMFFAETKCAPGSQHFVIKTDCKDTPYTPDQCHQVPNWPIKSVALTCNDKVPHPKHPKKDQVDICKKPEGSEEPLCNYRPPSRFSTPWMA